MEETENPIPTEPTDETDNSTAPLPERTDTGIASDEEGTGGDEPEQTEMDLGIPDTPARPDDSAPAAPAPADDAQAPDTGKEEEDDDQYTMLDLRVREAPPAQPSAEEQTDAVPEAPAAEESDGAETTPAADSTAPLLDRLSDRIAIAIGEDGKSKYDPEKPRRIDTAFDFIELFIFTLVFVLILTSFFFRHSVVDGGSMRNTLQNGEHLIISDLFYTPQRGDIVVCEVRLDGTLTRVVKRVIAVAGDRVRLAPDGVYVNGEKLTEDYVYTDFPYYQYSPMALTVPEGKVFVMGDHRNNSTDSRIFGCVDDDAILGRVLIRLFPFNKFGTVE